MQKNASKYLIILLCALLLIAMVPITTALAAKGLVFPIVQVSDPETSGNTIQFGCTTRNIAVGMDGTIYVVYYNAGGIYLTHSTDRGETVSDPVQVTTDSCEPEVAVSTSGTVYIAWNPMSGPKIARSIDGGNTFLDPVNVDTAGGGSTVHMATDGVNVYLLERSGRYFYSSIDGGQTFSTFDFIEGYAYADVHVNRTTHEVIVQKDDPAVIYYVSNDYGVTFAPKVITGKDVYFSVGTIGTDDIGSYLYVAGQNLGGGGDANLEKIDLSNGTASTILVPDSFGNQSRSLSADDYGNVVVGYIHMTDNDDGTHNLCFKESNDKGATFDEGVVVDVGEYACAAVNHTNGDILFAYEKTGQVYLAVYQDYLEGYDLNVSKAALSFPGQLVGSHSAYKTVTLSNNGDAPLTINSITVSGEFSATGTSITTLGVGESCDIEVRFDPTSTGNHTGKVEIQVEGVSTIRTINLMGVGVDTVPITISSVSDVEMDAADGSVDVPFTVTHDNPTFDFSTLLLSAVSSDNATVLKSGFTFSGSDGSYTLTITPESDASGLSNITIIANDQVFEDTETFMLTVNGGTLPSPSLSPSPSPGPTITPSPSQTPGDDTRTITGTLVDSNNKKLAGYALELHSDPITTITDSNGRFTFNNVPYTKHTLNVKTSTGTLLGSFALAFTEGEDFNKTVTGGGADIVYTSNTVSVDIAMSLNDEGEASIVEINDIENPQTGSMQMLWIWIAAAIIAITLTGCVVRKSVSVK